MKMRCGASRLGFRNRAWGAQAASLPVSAACRDPSFHCDATLFGAAGKLPAAAGWQPALPRQRMSAICCTGIWNEDSGMDLANIKNATEWFEVLQTSTRIQTAMMTLAPGDETGRKPEAHKNSDQVLLMLSGKLSGTVGPETVELKKGDVLLIRAGTLHRFKNPGQQRAVTCNVYSPPEYPSGTKG